MFNRLDPMVVVAALASLNDLDKIKHKTNELLPKIKSQPMSIYQKSPLGGRNVKCPCNSGKKFKKCCMKVSHELQTKKADS